MYALAVAILLQAAGWISVITAGVFAYRQFYAVPGWIAKYSGLGAFRPFLPATIAAIGLILVALGVLLHLNARRN